MKGDSTENEQNLNHKHRDYTGRKVEVVGEDVEQ